MVCLIFFPTPCKSKWCLGLQHCVWSAEHLFDFPLSPVCWLWSSYPHSTCYIKCHSFSFCFLQWRAVFNGTTAWSEFRVPIIYFSVCHPLTTWFRLSSRFSTTGTQETVPRLYCPLGNCPLYKHWPSLLDFFPFHFSSFLIFSAKMVYSSTARLFFYFKKTISVFARLKTVNFFPLIIHLPPVSWLIDIGTCLCLFADSHRGGSIFLPVLIGGFSLLSEWKERAGQNESPWLHDWPPGCGGRGVATLRLSSRQRGALTWANQFSCNPLHWPVCAKPANTSLARHVFLFLSSLIPPVLSWFHARLVFVIWPAMLFDGGRICIPTTHTQSRKVRSLDEEIAWSFNFCF